MYNLILSSYGYKAREVLPALLIGNVGVGKTSTVRKYAQQLAVQLNKQFVFLNELDNEELIKLSQNKEELNKIFPYLEIVATHLTPEFIQGIPNKIDNIYVMNTHIMVKILREVQGLIFIDELLNVSLKDIFSALLSLTLDKIFATIRIHPDTIIISAGNPPKYSSLSRELSSANLDRFYVFNVEPSLEEWIQLNQDKVHPSVIRFLRDNPSLFSLEIGEGMIEKFESISPRRWSRFGQDLHNMLKMGVDPTTVEKFIFMSLPQQIASRFVVFAESYLISLDELTIEQYKSMNMEQRDEVVKNLAKKIRAKLLDINENNKHDVENYLNKFTPLIQYLVKEDREMANIFLKSVDFNTVFSNISYTIFKQIHIKWYVDLHAYSKNLYERFSGSSNKIKIKPKA